MSTLSTFLTQHRRTKSSRHTHTWFGSRSTQTLTISPEDASTLQHLLVQDAKKTPQPTSDSPRCITEKVTRNHPFRFFADLDFQASSLDGWCQDHNTCDDDLAAILRGKLQSLVQLYQNVVSEATKTHDVEMVMTTRLPYKIHLHFPSIIVDTDQAKALATSFDQRFRDEHPDIYTENVSDLSNLKYLT